MNAKERILARMMSLLVEGGLPKTTCSDSLVRTLQPLIDAGVVVEQRSGSGRRLVLLDNTALRQFIGHFFPDTPINDDEMSRTAGVARFRDSKTFTSNTPEILSVRAWSEQALLKDGKPVGAALASSEHGVFSFLLSGRYAMRGSCAVVENPAVFTQFERLHLPADLVIWSHRGRISRRLIEWLESNATPDFSLIHLPDYDPVGMDEFTRLRTRLGARVRLYFPDDLPERFSRLSNHSILKKPNNRTLLANLRRTKLVEVRRVIALIDSNNACLEQEALLLPAELFSNVCPPIG
ncbi:MAG: hypothetical protein DMG31_15725 [Acidobacteria bacterium]|nr:MAG: hypothetical protein DMG31_15725 [Acidobacteriota bacterium]